jgi:lauroyl/myristoyl acyltransferase
VTSRERRLEAPHRRGGARPRIVERAGVVAYRATAWGLRVLPVRFARGAIGTLTRGSYLVAPDRQRWSNANFGHVLGLPPDDPRVRRLALRAYHEYGRYLVDLMRLPSLPADEVARLAGDLDEHEADIRRILADAPGGGLILTVGHLGSNEAIAANIARRGLPISVVADDSSFPELFELLREQRARWGVTLIPWRNLRAIYGVLRRREMLGLLIDWGYRSDGIPVRLFDAWTTLPAGPATLAAKTGSRILPISIHRDRTGVFQVAWSGAIDVASSDPAELQRATQAMADALADSIRIAPEQWYSFKPIWPDGPAEAADLERRAKAMQTGRPDPGPARGLPRDPADGVASDEMEAPAPGPGGEAATPLVTADATNDGVEAAR